MAITFAPGQTVAAPDWEALFQQHGGAKSNVIRPMTKAEETAALDAGEDPTQNPIYRYYADDGSYVEARKAPNGDYQIVAYQPSEKFQQTQRPATGTAAGTTTKVEGTPLPGGGFDNERPVKVTRDANGKQIGQAVPLTGKELDDWYADREKSRNPGRKTDQQIKDEKEAETKAAEARNARPGTKIRSRTETKNGRTVTIETWRLPDGSTEDRESSEPGPKEEILTGRGPNGEDVRVIRDANGQVVRYEPVAGGKTAEPDPTDMPAPTFVVGDAAKDLRDFDVYLAGKIGTGPGKITQAKADQLRENRRKLWDIALTEQQGLVNTQKAEADRRGNERGQTLSDQGNRRNSATSIANQATSSLLPYMDKMGAGANGADFVAALRYLRDSSQDFVTSTGANAYVPNVTPGPALTTINNASIPAPGSAPAAPFLSPTRPAAAVAPAFTPQPMAPPPAGPSQAAAATAAAQAAQRGAAAAAPPVPAPVAAPSPGYNPGNAQQAADAGLVPGQNPYQWSPDDQPLAPAPLFNAKPPEQQTLPLLPPQPGSPAGGNVQMMPTAAPFLSMTRGPQQQAAYDPMPSVQSMIDDPEWDNEAVRQAFRELYGRDLPMSA